MKPRFVIYITAVLLALFLGSIPVQASPDHPIPIQSGPIHTSFMVEMYEGDVVTLEFTNAENHPISVDLVNISYPISDLPLFYSPTQIAENSSENVSVHFLHLSEAELRGIPNGRYAVKLVGGGQEYLIYLYIENSAYVPGGRENLLERMDALENRIDRLETMLEENLAAFSADLDGFINSMAKFYGLTENVRENYAQIYSQWMSLVERAAVLGEQIDNLKNHASTNAAQVDELDRTLTFVCISLGVVMILFVGVVWWYKGGGKERFGGKEQPPAPPPKHREVEVGPDEVGE